MRTITFYSYKGGVGRTLALAQIAKLLAAEGKKVFILDLDLEAPGIHFKFPPAKEQSDALVGGFVELVYEFLFHYDFPSIEKYTYSIRSSEHPHEIRVMPAGKARVGDYWQKLTKINWQELFGGKQGQLEPDADEMPDGPPILLEVKDRIEETYSPDFLLIDARTGITEVGGAALTLLPDDVVCLFSNNEESKWGIREITRAIPRTPRLRDQEPVRVVPVLTRFPQRREDEAEVLQKALEYLNTPASDGKYMRFDEVFILHSEPNVEADEVKGINALTKDSQLLQDYLDFFVKGLRLRESDVKRLDLEVVQQQAREALDAGNASVAEEKWREVVEHVRAQSTVDANLLVEAAKGLALALSQREKPAGVEIKAQARTIADAAEAPSTFRVEALRHIVYNLSDETVNGIEREILGLIDELNVVELRTQTPTRVAPTPASLPSKRPLSSRSGAPTVSFDVPLSVVTPILGGAAETREIDEVDFIRAPTIRGHLRFWWRALYAGSLSPQELYKRERTLWGGAADEAGGRSSVEIRVFVLQETLGRVDDSNVMPYGREQTPGAYALWPARESKKRGEVQPIAPRRLPGTRFSLHVHCHAGDETEIRAAIRAWILFGGYGGRTRRGAGSLTIEDKDARRIWLPRSLERQALTDVFLRDIFEPLTNHSASDLPMLAGAGLRMGDENHDAMDTWKHALKWLQDFRHADPGGGEKKHDPKYARMGSGGGRPGRSHWPESDKVRRLSGVNTQWTHPPQHNQVPVWPRAAFGLPIIAQFQRMDRNTKQHYPPPGEPNDFKLHWRSEDGTEQKRLASPLIVKALPLANGKFAPCALWLHRGYPKGGKVIIEARDSRSHGSEADFDILVAQGDSARYEWLERHRHDDDGERLRNAFFDWLAWKEKTIRKVAR